MLGALLGGCVKIDVGGRNWRGAAGAVNWSIETRKCSNSCVNSIVRKAECVLEKFRK